VLRREDQRGFTLVELSVAMTIMLLVAGALLAALESGTRAERRASTRIDDEQSVRVALAELTHDVRNATALLPDATNTNSIDLAVPGPQEVRWWYDAAGHVLQRSTLDVALSTPSAKAFDKGLSIPNVVNPPGSVFTFLAPDGTNVFADPSATSADAAACTATIGVSVTVTGHPPSAPFTESAEPPVNAAADRRGCP